MVSDNHLKVLYRLKKDLGNLGETELSIIVRIEVYDCIFIKISLFIYSDVLAAFRCHK